MTSYPEFQVPQCTTSDQVHPATPKSSARGGARRYPPGVAPYIQGAMPRAEFMSLLESAQGLMLPARAEVVTHRAGHVEAVRASQLMSKVGWWRDLWPIRRIGTYRNAPNRIGMYVVEQGGHRLMIETESGEELAHIRDRQFFGGASWMLTQPFVLRWPLEERCAWRVPDLLGVDDEGVFVADIKPEQTRTEFSDAMFELTRASLEHAGVRYMVLGEQSVQRKRNLRALASQRWASEPLREAISAARKHRRTSLGGVIDSAGGGATGTAAALHLLTQELSADLDQHLTYGTPVSWRDNR